VLGFEQFPQITQGQIWRNRDESTICTVPPDVRQEDMVPLKTFKWLIALSVAAGLMLAPLSVSAIAAPQTAPGSDRMQSMSDEMPCCPDEQKSKDCQDCPLVAMCVLKTVQAGPASTEALPVRHAIRTTHAVRNDVAADGLDRPPPDHPPRNLA
jgi:hypothetical protein